MKLQIVLIASKRLALLNPEIFERAAVHLLCGEEQAIPAAVRARVKSVFLVPEVFNPGTLVMEYDRDSMAQILEGLTGAFPSESIRIVCSDEAHLEAAAHLRERFSIQGGLRPQELVPFRDKVEMKKRLARHGISVPQFMAQLSADPQLQFERLQGFFKGPFVIKPRASVGSRSIYKIRTQADFEAFSNACRDALPRYEAETLIKGDLYQCDLVLRGGRVLTALASRYSRHTTALQEGKNMGSIPLRQEDETAQRLLAFAEKALSALGGSTGCFHMELFLTQSDKIVFLEVGARAAGMLTVPVYRDSFGVDLLEMDFSIQSGLELPTQARGNETGNYSFFMIFPKREGRITALNTPVIGSPYRLDWQVAKGEQTRPTKTNIDYAGVIQVWNEDYDDLSRDFKYLNDDFIPIQYSSGS